MKKKLKDIADVRTGYQFRGKVSASDDANVSVIQIKDVDEQMRIRTSDLLHVKIDNPKPYLVSQGDVLFLSRGHRQYATIVTEPVKDTIATGYFYIVRANETFIRPSFLAWTINEPDFQETLRPLVRGSHIALISKADFQDICIEVPPLDVQDRIIAIQALYEREKFLSAAVEGKREQFVRAVCHALINGRSRVKRN